MLLASVPFDVLRDLTGPALVFIGLCAWLIRKVVKAARTESDLEGERLAGALADELSRAKAVARGEVIPLKPEGAPRGSPSRAPASTPPGAPPAATRRPTAAEFLADAAASAAGADKPRPRPHLPAPSPIAGADLTGALPEHVRLVSLLAAEREQAVRALAASAPEVRRVEVLWVKSGRGHVAWCERRYPAIPEATAVRDVICVARIEDGEAAERWSFG